MSSVNNLLFSVQNMAPALLSIGAGSRSTGYDSLGALNNAFLGSNTSNNIFGNNSTSSSSADKVSLTYKSIANKMVNDMAAVTADTIKQFPELDKDYVIALIDDGETREARVYRRSDIFENFKGTEKEKKELEAQLAANPLMVFSNGSGLPETKSDKASQALADNLNDFLKTNAKTFNTLDKNGYDPFADLMGSSTMKKMLANYAAGGAASDDLTGRDLSKKLLADLMEIIEAAAKENSSLKDDYVVAIIDDGVSREARVYSRSAILDNFQGTDKEKAELKAKLDKNPVMVFSSDSGLPATDSGSAFEKMAASINDFFKENSKDLDKLDKQGFDPLADLLGFSDIKKILANYASSLLADEEEE